MNQQLINEANKYTSKIKVSLMRHKEFTFYLAIIFQMKIKWDESIPMIAVDGTYFTINPVYWLARPIEDCIDDLLHETLHVVLNHLPRIKKYKAANFNKYNLAADYALNNILIESGRTLDKTFMIERKYKGKSAEEIYNLLPDPPKDYKPDIKPNDKMDDKQLEEKLKQIISNAKTQAEVNKRYSDVHSITRRMVDELLDPILPWNSILANYMNSYDKSDYSWSKRSRHSEEMYLPSLHAPAMEPINIYPDCSGSISEKLYVEILSEISGIIDNLTPEFTRVVNWGSGLTKHEITVYPDETLLDKCKLENLGGTELTPVIQHINETRPELAIVFTDGFYNAPRITPEVDTLFIVWGNPRYKTNMGTVIHYKKEK